MHLVIRGVWIVGFATLGSRRVNGLNDIEGLLGRIWRFLNG